MQKNHYIKSNTTFGDDSKFFSQILHRYGGWHSPYSMFKVENGVLLLNDEVSQSDLMISLKAFIQYLYINMDKEDNNFMYYTLASYMVKDRLKNYGEDYSKAPSGFFKRFYELCRNFENIDNDFTISDILSLMKPIFSEIGIKIVIGKITPKKRFVFRKSEDENASLTNNFLKNRIVFKSDKLNIFKRKSFNFRLGLDKIRVIFFKL